MAARRTRSRSRPRRRRKNANAKALTIATRDSTKADVLKAAAVSYFLKGGFSCFTELGLQKWGTRRADMLGLNLRQQIVLCEIKSSVADYRTDTKWREYLKYCHRMYFVFCPLTYDKLKERIADDFKGTGVGVMTLNPKTGYLDIVKPASVRDVDPATVMQLITRMAWRGGISKRTNKRTRHYLTPTQEANDGSSHNTEEAEAPTDRRRRSRRTGEVVAQEDARTKATTRRRKASPAEEAKEVLQAEDIFSRPPPRPEAGHAGNARRKSRIA